MTKTLSAQQARNTVIFIFNNYTNKIEETTLYDHVIESAEETTSPRGVEHKMFIKEVEGEENFYYELREWMPNGKSRLLGTYDTEEAANDEWYTRTYNYDFMPDDQRDTMYWNTREEAEVALQERNNDK